MLTATTHSLCRGQPVCKGEGELGCSDAVFGFLIEVSDGSRPMHTSRLRFGQALLRHQFIGREAANSIQAREGFSFGSEDVDMENLVPTDPNASKRDS